MKISFLTVAYLSLLIFGCASVSAQPATVEFTSDSYPVATFGELTFALKLSVPLNQSTEVGVELLSDDPNGPSPDNPWLSGYVTIPAGETIRSVTLLAPNLGMFGGQIRLSGEASPDNSVPGQQRMAKLIATQPQAEVRFMLLGQNDVGPGPYTRARISIVVNTPTNIIVSYTTALVPAAALPAGAISAMPGRDFDSVSGTLTFRPGVGVADVNISFRPDRDRLSPPAFVLLKLSTTNEAARLSRSEFLVEVRSLLQFSLPSPPVAAEGDPGFGVAFWSFGGPVSFRYATRERTARASLDFTAVQGEARGATNGWIAMPILDNGVVGTTKEFDLVLSRPDTGESFRTLPIPIADNERPIPAAKDATFRATANFSQVWVRPDGKLLLLVDRDNLEFHTLTASGSLEQTVLLAPGSIGTDYEVPGMVEPTGSLLLNNNGSSVTGHLLLNSASSIVRVRPDGSIDSGFRILGVRPGSGGARALYVDVEGKILVALDGRDLEEWTWLVRYLPDGTRDTSFKPRWLEHIILSVAGPRADGRFNVIYRLWPGNSAATVRQRPGILDLTREEASLEEVGAPGEFSPVLATSDGWYVSDRVTFALSGIEGLIKISSDGRRAPEFFLPQFPFSSHPSLAAAQPDGKVLAFIEGEHGTEFVRFQSSTSQQGTRIEAAPILQFALRAVGRVEIPVHRAGDTSRLQTVHYATRDDSAKAGLDYVGTSGLVTFQPLEVEQRVEIKLLAGTPLGLFGSFLLTLSDPSGGATLGTSETVVRLADEASTLAISRSNGKITLLARAFRYGLSRLVLEKTRTLSTAKWEPVIDPATGLEATRLWGGDTITELSIELPVPQGQSFFRARLSRW